jgi:hypothetical protein
MRIDRYLKRTSPQPTTEVSHNTDLADVVAEVLSVKDVRRYLTNQESQDFHSLVRGQQFIVAALSDGAGACELSQFGARFFCQSATDFLSVHPEITRGELQPEKLLTDLYLHLYDRAYELCNVLQLSPYDARDTLLAASLEVTVMTPQLTLVASLSDGFLSTSQGTLSTSKICERDPSLSRYNIVPSLAHAIVADSGTEAEIKKTVQETGVNSSIVEATVHALHEEAKSFHITYLGETSEFLKLTPAQSTDGLRFCAIVSHAERKVSFPLEILRIMPINEARDLLLLFNMTSILHDRRDENTIISIRGIIADLARTHFATRSEEVSSLLSLASEQIDRLPPYTTQTSDQYGEFLHWLKVEIEEIITTTTATVGHNISFPPRCAVAGITDDLTLIRFRKSQI